MKITSEQFQNNGRIPSKYTCVGENINPSLQIYDVPEKTLSLVLIVDDPEATKGTFTHWVVYDIPPISQIKENSLPGIAGANGSQKNSYTGPCPPSGTHHYHFKLYALDTKLDLPEGQTKIQVEKAMNGHIITQDKLIGLFAKEDKNKEWKEPLDGVYSDSEVGGEAKTQQNPWQGSQERWQQP